MTIFYCLRFETPSTWRARSPCLYSPETEWPGYNPGHWVPFSSHPTTHRATVEIFDPTSLRESLSLGGLGFLSGQTDREDTFQSRIHENVRLSPSDGLFPRIYRNVFAGLFSSNGSTRHSIITCSLSFLVLCTRT
jgi:hypothetical protein